MKLVNDLNTQVLLSSKTPSEEYFESVRNNSKEWDIMKPFGGLWTSTYTPDKKYLSAWHRHCIETDLGYYNRNREHKISKPPNEAYLLYPSENIKVLEICSKSEVEKLIDEYIVQEDYSLYIDFEKMSEEYDGLRLTDNAACALSVLNKDESSRYYNRILEWDCESTLWFEYCFDKVEDYKT